MNAKNLVIALFLATSTLGLLAPPTAEAIPAFARQYKMSCNTCHSPFPRLKDFGNEFAANGFTIPEQEKDRDFITAGDDLLRLNRTFPIAVRFDAFAFFECGTEVTNDLQTPWALKLLSGGSLSKNVGYYFYFFMDERGEVGGVEDAYIHFNNIMGKPLDVMVGQFQTSDPLMKRELRLTYEDYMLYKTRVGLSQNNLTYDRGVMTTYDIGKTGTDLVALIVNGNGKPDAYEEDDGNKKFDTDKYKCYAVKVNQSLGQYAGAGYYYYYGQELGMDHLAGPNPLSYMNRILHHGPDFRVGNGMFDFTFQYLIRRDTNPGFTADAVNVETKGVIAELVFSPQRDRSRYYFTLLYNQIDSDWDEHDYESMTGGVTYLVARNLRITLEYTRNLELDTNRGIVGLVSAF